MSTPQSLDESSGDSRIYRDRTKDYGPEQDSMSAGERLFHRAALQSAAIQTLAGTRRLASQRCSHPRFFPFRIGSSLAVSPRWPLVLSPVSLRRYVICWQDEIDCLRDGSFW